MFKYIAAAALFALVPQAANATDLVIGTGTGENAFPFGGKLTGSNSTNYQQVYASSLFGTSPTRITGISFTLDHGEAATGTFTLGLSTTSRAVNALNDNNFSSNLGVDFVQIYSGTLSGKVVNDILSFDFGAFRYDPSRGNLLLDVTSSGVSAPTGFFKANNGTANGAFSRASNYGVGTNNYGLQTTFKLGAVPEPATWAMMMLGFGLVGYAMRRRPLVRFA